MSGERESVERERRGMDSHKLEMEIVSRQMADSQTVSDTDRLSVRQMCDSQCTRQSPGTVRQKSDCPETVCMKSNSDTVRV